MNANVSDIGTNGKVVIPTADKKPNDRGCCCMFSMKKGVNTPKQKIKKPGSELFFAAIPMAGWASFYPPVIFLAQSLCRNSCKQRKVALG